MAVYRSGSLLSGVYLTLEARLLSLYANMFAVCHRGTTQAWTDKGAAISHLAHSTLQSMGRLGLRPCTIKKGSSQLPFFGNHHLFKVYLNRDRLLAELYALGLKLTHSVVVA